MCVAVKKTEVRQNCFIVYLCFTTLFTHYLFFGDFYNTNVYKTALKEIQKLPFVDLSCLHHQIT